MFFFSSLYHNLEYKTAYQFSAHQFFISSIVFLVSCPPEWIKDDEMCYMYKGGSFTFTDAEKYCGVSAVDTDTLFMSFFLLFWLWFFFFYLFISLYSTPLYFSLSCFHLRETKWNEFWGEMNTLGGKEIKLGGDSTEGDMGGCFASSPSPSVSPSSNCILFLY